MEALRTPEDRFADLDDWPFEPRVTDVGDGLRMHHVDEGPRDGPVVLLTHGEPTWGYLNRKLIPELVARGRRVLAPDLIGFGRSDKPVRREDYTYERHVAWTGRWMDAVGVEDAVVLGQDWGGLTFLVHVGRQPERFAGVVAANTALPDPAMSMADVPPEMISPFLEWLQFSQEMDPFLASEVVGGDSPLNQTGHQLSEGEARAYDAPFPDESYCCGARQFPLIVPLDPAADPPASMLAEAWRGLERFDRPFVTAWSDHETVTSFFEQRFQERVPGARDQDHVTVARSGHFVQEHGAAQLVEVLSALTS